VACVFESLDKVREIVETWLLEYNDDRPHDSLGRVPPTQFLPGQHPDEIMQSRLELPELSRQQQLTRRSRLARLLMPVKATGSGTRQKKNKKRGACEMVALRHQCTLLGIVLVMSVPAQAALLWDARYATPGLFSRASAGYLEEANLPKTTPVILLSSSMGRPIRPTRRGKCPPLR
jgi:hypothetical protein